MAPSRRAAADGAQRAQPVAGPWTSGVNHHQKIRPTGRKHLKDLREGEQLATDLRDLLAGARDVNLMGLHVGFSDRAALYYMT